MNGNGQHSSLYNTKTIMTVKFYSTWPCALKVVVAVINALSQQAGALGHLNSMFAGKARSLPLVKTLNAFKY